MCTRNRISPPKSVHKGHIEMTKTLRYTTLEYTLPLFDMNRQRGQWEKRATDEGMNNDNNAGGKNEKFLKTTLKITLNMQNTRFSRLKWVANKMPGQAAKTLKDKILKKFSKCFLRLEGLPTRESRTEPWKFLCNPRDWTFYSRTSCQNWPASSRLWHATGLTHDWVAKIGQKWFLKIFNFKEQNIFQKHLKHSKIFLCLNQQRLSMWEHISSSTITQMNMAFIEHRLVCCVWISIRR